MILEEEGRGGGRWGEEGGRGGGEKGGVGGRSSTLSNTITIFVNINKCSVSKESGRNIYKFIPVPILKLSNSFLCYSGSALPDVPSRMCLVGCPPKLINEWKFCLAHASELHGCCYFFCNS